MFRVLFAVIYTIVYAFLAITHVNSERTGTGIFIVPLVSWLFILAALYLSNKLTVWRNRLFFIALMAAHYWMNLLLTDAFSADFYNGKSRLVAAWEREPNRILLTIGWYLAGQLVIWAMFFNSFMKLGKTEKQN